MSVITSQSPSVSLETISGVVTPDDLLSMDGLFELVDGRIVEKHMSFEGGDTTVIVSSLLHAFVKHHQLGKVVSEVTFRCFINKPNQVRRPDIAFVSAARLPQVPKEGHVPIRPDLAIEIVSPGDEVYDLEDKLDDYESAAIPLVWILNPHLKTISVLHPHQPTVKLRAEDQLSGEEILPGFLVKVAEFFPQS